MRAVQVAAVAPVDESFAAAQARKLCGAGDEQFADEAREPGERDEAGALLDVTEGDGAIAEQHRRDPGQHGKRPESESPEAVLVEEGTM